MDLGQLVGQLEKKALLRIFYFLDELSLIQASQVNKHWNNVAQTDSLWRDLCLKKWYSCHFIESGDVTSWKEFYFKQMIQKFRMFSAKPEDFDCIMICEDLGLIIEVAYLSGCDQTINGEGKPIVIIEFGYTRPKRFILTAWDIQKGMKIWSSSDQSSKMSVLKTLPQLGLALTYSEDLYIKVWDCSHSDAVASVRMPLPCITLEPFMSKHGSFLMVGDGSGSIYSLLLPKLQAIHKIKVFKYSVDIIKVSPNTKWIFACGIHQTVWPVIIFSEHLQKEKEREIPLLYLKIAPCVEAFWSPKKPNRIIMMRQIFSKITVEFITCDIQTELYGDKSNTQANQVASFLLSDDMGVHFKTGVSNENMIVVENGPVLNIFSIDGVLLQQYTNHKQDISKIWTDSVHVITFSKDNSLHLYMWDERSHSPLLKSCCHLDLGPIDFKEMDPYFLQCDDVSIVSVKSSANSSRLVMYFLKT